jgi:hypothetical protein
MVRSAPSGHRGSPPELEPLQVGKVKSRDYAPAGRGAVDAPIVDAHQRAVTGHPHVALHGVRAQPYGLPVGGQGVFRLVRRGTTMGHDFDGAQLGAVYCHHPATVPEASSALSAGAAAPPARRIASA